MIVALFDAMRPFNVTYESETIAMRNSHSLADTRAEVYLGDRDVYFFDAIL